ncbi:MAG: glycoside hydrolase family 3 protein [Acidimicrobiia bacterium]|nr:glycoside hydrolase family 3 protein [Acidimicrobiia bacterium]
MTERIESLLGRLTLEEKVAICSGADLWHSGGVERLGVGALKVSDGPSGVRGERFSGTSSTSFPCGTALGATWDTGLVRLVGEAMGDEARGKGVHVVLAPTVNIHRHPLAGRNFECYSEDPYLSARMSVAFVEGVQSRGVGCSVKHFVANDQEHDRMTISAEVDERTLREIYLPPFEAAVREAGAWAVMSAYNRVGGTYCAEHRDLLTGILKEEWGFDGFVISDWWGTHSTDTAANAGLDLEMPGPVRWFGTHLVQAVSAGDVAEEVVDGMARRMLRAAERTGALDRPGVGEEDCTERPERSAVARRAATESVVLLRNDGGVLPFDAPSLGSIAIIGAHAAYPAVMGGGSSMVTPHRVSTPLASLRSGVGGAVDVVYERGAPSAPAPLPVLGDAHLAAPCGASTGVGRPSTGLRRSWRRANAPTSCGCRTGPTRSTSPPTPCG